MTAFSRENRAADIYSAAYFGEAQAVERFLALDPTLATRAGGPLDRDALTYLCFSDHFQSEPALAGGFLRAATALLDAGASAATGYWERDHQPKPEWESVIYGASAVVRNPELTRLLLERGADPNDEETPYHSPEGYDNATLAVLVESGKLTAESLATMLLRKADWHDADGALYLLRHGADPNRMTRWGYTALHQALRRDNRLEAVAGMLQHGADPSLLTLHERLSGISIAIRRGRGDVLRLFRERGVVVNGVGIERLVAACAIADSAAVGLIADEAPELAHGLPAMGGTLLAEFAGNGNSAGVGLLLDLGVDVASRYRQGDGYFGVARESTALHVAAWRARAGTVKLLLERGAPVNARDSEGNTPLMLAVRACVDSHWMGRRTPESVRDLLAAGADPSGVRYPCGYAEVDDLLKPHLA